MIVNVVIQIIGMIGTVFYFLSYQFKDTKTLFKVQFISYSFYTIHFFLLGATTGAVSYAVDLLKCSFLSSSNNEFHKKKYCLIICILQILVGIITWNGYVSLLPIIANVVLTIGNYTYDENIIRYSGLLVNSPLWLIHNALVGSLAGVIDEVITMLSIGLSLIRFRKNH